MITTHIRCAGSGDMRGSACRLDGLWTEFPGTPDPTVSQTWVMEAGAAFLHIYLDDDQRLVLIAAADADIVAVLTANLTEPTGCDGFIWPHRAVLR